MTAAVVILAVACLCLAAFAWWCWALAMDAGVTIDQHRAEAVGEYQRRVKAEATLAKIREALG